MPNSRLAVGVMSGTSIDGLDAALVRIDGHGLEMRPWLIGFESRSLGDLAPRLRAIANQKPATAEEIAEVAWQFGKLHVELIERLLFQALMNSCDLSPAHIAVHGQTVFHRPPVSWQLINDAPIRARWPEAAVASDLRQEDLTMGGQGAPITPLADWVMFRDEVRSRAIVNLGGFCNITTLPKQSVAPAGPLISEEALHGVQGFDVCACNHILDKIARETMNLPFDDGGALALSGSPNPRAVERLFRVLTCQHSENRSLGTGDEAIAWVEAHAQSGEAALPQSEFEPLSPADLAASAARAIVRTIAASLARTEVDQIILAGGGARNGALARDIAAFARCETMRSDSLGVPVQAREAVAIAILGVLRADGVPITLPHVTGRRARPIPL